VNATVWVLLGGFFAVAALDWLAVARRNKPLEYVCKPGCMLLLVGAALALDVDDGGARVALVAALVLSTAGDAFLMVDRFLPGLASFLLGHVAYVVAFSLDGLDAGWVGAGIATAAVLVTAVGRPTVGAVRRGEHRELAGPVAAYVGVISVMLLTAVGTGDPRAAVGAALFAGSDSLIAQERFVRPRPWQPLAIIVGYHVAQGVILTAFAQG
jgi:uncharacterized membrane protein YhhN